MASIMKAYSLALNTAGRPGPVPEGMSATTALRSKWLDEQHQAIKAEVLRRAEAFAAKLGYEPPYWQLFEMARAAVARQFGEVS